jgi:hypothetical protein
MIGFFTAAGLPEEPSEITRADVETFLVEFAEGHKPATVQTRCKCLRFFLPSSWRREITSVQWRT